MKNWGFEMLRGFEIVLGTKRGLRQFALHSLASFGLISALFQFFSVVYVPSRGLSHPLGIIIGVSLTSLAYGLLRSWPHRKVGRQFKNPDMTINVVVGDILDFQGQIVVGFSDTFDTDTSNNKVISSSSLQGQLLKKSYNDSSSELDSVLSTALHEKEITNEEKRAEKRHGKLKRYPVGTVAVLEGSDNNRIYALAYSVMGNDLVAKSTVHDVWYSLGQLWDSVYLNGQRQPIALPLIGSGLARINCLDRESLLRMILLSFVSRSREELICHEMTIYVDPNDHEKINMLEIAAFLRTL